MIKLSDIIGICNLMVSIIRLILDYLKNKRK